MLNGSRHTPSVVVTAGAGAAGLGKAGPAPVVRPRKACQISSGFLWSQWMSLRRAASLFLHDPGNDQGNCVGRDMPPSRNGEYAPEELWPASLRKW